VRWRRSSGDDAGIEDRRSQGPTASGFRFPGGKVGAGGGGILGIIIAVVVALIASRGGSAGFGIDPNVDPFGAAPAASSQALDGAPDSEENLRAFVAFVQRDVQDAWSNIFTRAGRGYQPTVVVLFRGNTDTPCGTASASTGPFYCPPDRKVYLDLAFFQDLANRFGAPGDFAQAYVVAHEFGHHVQNLLGTANEVAAAQQNDPESANELSVRLELQADCYAGIWAHTAFQQNLLEQGDLEEGLNAAAAVGDDRIQQSAGMRVNPDSFTHGTSEQRQRWFRTGFDSGDLRDCDTFNNDL
jgi:predicted metalloprotease